MSTKLRVIAAWSVLVLALAGCGDDGGDGNGGAAGTVAGMAAGMDSTAGTTAGTTTAGVGGESGAAGTASGGTGGGSGGEPGCEVAATGTPAELHDAALMTLQSCGLSNSCHSASGLRANLVLIAGSNLNTLLVDVPSCQVPTIPLVKSGGGQQALDGSWLWQKFTAPVDSLGELIANDAWGTPVTTCNQASGSGFGLRMPWGFEPGEGQKTAVRNWICAGAAAP